MEEPFKRITLSFYKYVWLTHVSDFRYKLFLEFNKLNVFGRIYVANEGINAQMSVPEENFESFKNLLYSYAEFKDVPLKIAVDDDGKSFYKLIIKVRKKIVADGLRDGDFDVTNVGKHLTAEEFNTELEKPDTIVVDMRNHYESEVGHFRNSILPDSDTFKDELPMVVDMLKEKKDKKILMYCTGGIRCEKASAYLKHHGFSDVNQLYGGIIQYAREIKEKGLESKYIGKNFVFDERIGERITDDVIAHCHQCGNPCDDHTNCANIDCHSLFIQCHSCKEKMKGCCSDECMAIIELPEEEQKRIRKGQKNKDGNKIYKKGRLRPNMTKISKES